MYKQVSSVLERITASHDMHLECRMFNLHHPVTVIPAAQIPVVEGETLLIEEPNTVCRLQLRSRLSCGPVAGGERVLFEENRRPALPVDECLQDGPEARVRQKGGGPATVPSCNNNILYLYVLPSKEGLRGRQ